MKGPTAPLFIGSWSGGLVLHGQHQTPLHNPDLDRRMNGKARLFQPSALHRDPGYGGVDGSVEVGVILVFDDARIDRLADLDGTGLTRLVFRCRAPNYHRIIFQTFDRRILKIYDRFSTFSS